MLFYLHYFIHIQGVQIWCNFYVFLLKEKLEHVHNACQRPFICSKGCNIFDFFFVCVCVCVLYRCLLIYTFYFSLFIISLKKFNCHNIFLYSENLGVQLFHIFVIFFVHTHDKNLHLGGAFVVTLEMIFVGALKQTSIFQASLKYSAFLKWMKEGIGVIDLDHSSIYFCCHIHKVKRHKLRFLLCDRLVTHVTRRWSPRFKV